MILYPTETLYALGVNALDQDAQKQLYALKGRDASKPASWLVRTLEDIERYAAVGEVAAKIAERFLPGRLTLILRALPIVPEFRRKLDNEVSFRISADPYAQEVIEAFMAEHNAPLTCTSANVSGLATLGTVGEILQQFGEKAGMIDTIVDGGPRKGLASTVVRVVDEEITVLREGDISEADIRAVLQ
jgi:L-threonylcarbamoyladenylate synthase